MLEFTDGSKEEHPLGLYNQYKISNETSFGLPMAIKGRWIKHKLLEIDYNRLCRIEDYKFRITFLDNSLKIKVSERTKEINETLVGKAIQKGDLSHELYFIQ
jgi:hypothetical protein